MDTDSKGHRRYRTWRAVLFVFVLLPLLPEALILLSSAYAAAIGCEIDAKTACAIGPPSVSDLIRKALRAAYYIGSRFADDNVVVGWLLVCFVLIVLGWSRLGSRLLLGFGVSLILAFLPYFGPKLAIEPLVNANCHPHEGGVPPECTIYGGDVGNAAHNAVRLGWKFFYGAPVALGAFVVFAILIIAMAAISRRRSRAREEVPELPAGRPK
jgi:hypothetical protein